MVHRQNLVRSLATLAVIAVILSAIYALWIRYQVEPVTRDGKVRADLVPIAPDVSGLVTDVRVVDNQAVRKGEILFVIDQPRYRLALEQAQANVAAQETALAQADREDRRNRAMPDVIAAELIEQGRAKAEGLQASTGQAVAARDLARFNLERTVVRAPFDGTVSNVSLQPGVYLTAGKPALALVYNHSMRVEGYFEETKLPLICIGAPVRVRLMGENTDLVGRVDSIAYGINDPTRSSSHNLLPNVDPTFSWVRLAQRIPVEVKLSQVPPNIRLISGRTATVTVQPAQKDAPQGNCRHG